jgi:DNA polymerase-3 subunit epsilon
MIRRALLIDTETTSLDPKDGRVIEIGAVVYSLTSRTTLAQFSGLLPADSNAAENINRIPTAALAEVKELDDSASPLKTTLSMLRSWCDVIVAHHADFDRQWFRGPWLEKPWLCTKYDFSWPMQSREGESLINLALQHGIGVSSAHRALTDCQLLAALFDRMSYYGRDLQEMFAYAMRPKAIFQGLQPRDQNDAAKAAGFKWNPESKTWTRRLAIEDAAALPFKVQQLAEVA